METSPANHDPTVTAADRVRQVRRAVIASTVGSAIEWYDFILYSIATTLVFPSVFFAGSDLLAGELKSTAVFAIGFLARPVGAIIFGHYGDKLGRKASLVATLLLMGIGTFTVGLLPSYAQAGPWGGLALVAFRFLQGIGVGGEWSGAVLVAMEWAPPGRRGFFASWPQVGVPLGLILANLAFGAAAAVSGSSFLSWGWRVPFLLSGILVIVGLLIRIGVEETPVFKAMAQHRQLQKRPVLAALRTDWRKIGKTAMLRISELSNYQVMTVFVYTFVTQTLHLPRQFTFTAILCAAVLAVIFVPVFGAVSDRFGRKRTFMTGVALTGVFGFAYFALLSTGVPTIVFITIAVCLIPHAMQYGPEAAFITESFAAGTRYSGSAVGYQLASIVAGPVPAITVALFAYDPSGYAIAFYLGVCAIISLTSAYFMPGSLSRPHPLRHAEAA
ncbi:MAG TPA: MFS transporter [Acetobacteraceae bacterium]|nr:MFS transporter [Acetobacteraceae bacterium]